MTTITDSLDQQIRDCILSEIAPMFDDLRRFTDRRIAELSAEVHATVQLVDYSESNLSGQLQNIQGQVAALVAMPAAATRNSGLELEMVVQATEAAANQIMEAAEAIGDWLRDGGRDADSLEGVASKLSTIFEACSFQDVTGQRVRRAIHHLQQVESMLGDLMPANSEKAVPPTHQVPSEDRMQADIDALFADTRPHVAGAPILSNLVGPDLGQSDIDSMF